MRKRMTCLLVVVQRRNLSRDDHATGGRVAMDRSGSFGGPGVWSWRSLVCWVGCGVCAACRCPPTTVAAEPKPAAIPAAKEADPEVLKIHLMDGSQMGGKLAAHELDVDTAFGKLTIPVAAIVSLTPGLGSHPQVGQSLNELIEKFGSPVFSEREGRRNALVAMGSSIRLKLARACRRSRHRASQPREGDP